MNVPAHSPTTSVTPAAATPASGSDDQPSPLHLALTANKLRLLSALRHAGVACATTTYFGEGDSGSVDHVHAAGADHSVIDLSGHTVTYEQCQHWFQGSQWVSQSRTNEMQLADALRAFADNAVSLYHDGYENNDGGSGEVIFDCASGTVRLEHVDYYTTSEWTDTEL